MPETVSSLTIVTAEERAMDSQVLADDISFWGRMSAEKGKKTRRVRFSDLAASVRATITLIKGDPGDAGPVGPKGDAGEAGQTGPAGPQGPAGEAGGVGAQGPEGDQGISGTTGPAGIQGPKGDSGAAGSTGASGTKGDAGAAGAKGDPGIQGATGVANCRSKRVAMTASLIGIGQAKQVTVTWPTAFADANYSPFAILQPSTGNLASYRVEVVSWTTTDATFQVINNGLTLSPAMTLVASALHD